MIASLHGVVQEVAGAVAILDVNGVGYEVYCTAACRERLTPGEKALIVVFTEVQEQLLRLYGFADRLEKQTFLLLLRVKGVGAKSAAEIVSNVDKRELLKAIADGDLTRLQSVRGVGRKTAERIIVELRDKVAAFVLEQQITSTARVGGIGRGGPAGEAIEALVALGFARKDAERAVREAEAQGLSADAESGDIIREALRRV